MIAPPTVHNDRTALPASLPRKTLNRLARRAAIRFCRRRGARLTWLTWTLLIWPGDMNPQLQVAFHGDRGKGKGITGSATIDL